MTTGASWKDNIRLLGRGLGKEYLDERRSREYEDRARRVGEAIKAKTGGVPTARPYSSGSFPGTMLRDAGLSRSAGQLDSTDKISVDLSQEHITKLDAGVVFVSTWQDAKNEPKNVRAAFQGNPLGAKLNGKVTEVNEDTRVSSVSPQGAQAILNDIATHFGADPERTGRRNEKKFWISSGQGSSQGSTVCTPRTLDLCVCSSRAPCSANPPSWPALPGSALLVEGFDNF